MAQTQINTRLAQVHVVEESSQDTYVAPANNGTGMFMAEIGDSPLAVSSSNFEPTYHRADYLSMDEIPGSVSATISFRFPLKGSGSADTAPEFGECLKACGLEETIPGAGGAITYTPLSTFDGTGGNPGPSYSCTVLEDGLAYAVKGAFGTFTISAPVGEPAYCDVTMTGAYVAPADDALETPTYQTTVAPAFMGASITIAGATPKGVENLEFDLGNIIRMGPDANEATGFYGARITGRKSSGSLDPEAVLVATRDDFALWRAGTTGAITTGAVGSGADNSWQIDIARASRRPPELSNADGIRKYSIPFGVVALATDVEGTNFDFTLTFT